ncbi:hypothetical protein ACMVV3_004409, partial [Shigella flexneri]
MKSAFRFFNSCYSRFMSALDDASSSGCQYLLVEEIKTKMAAGMLPMRPVSGAYCHHGSLTPVFTLLPV